MKILFRLILVLAFATRQVQLNRLQKIKAKLLKEDIEHVLRRLSRLTQEETQMAVVQNMEVVYGLVSNIGVVMDGGRVSIHEILPALGMLDFIQRFRYHN